MVGPGKNSDQVKIQFDYGPTLSIGLKQGIQDKKSYDKEFRRADAQANREHPIIKKIVRSDGSIYIRRKS